jgi:hypothetical protein
MSVYAEGALAAIRHCRIMAIAFCRSSTTERLRTGNPGFPSCFAHLRRPSLRRSEHNVPILLHAHDGDPVVLSLVERLGQRAQPELSVVGCLPGCVVMVEKQREPRP